MHINKVTINNFRRLKDSTLDLRENISLLIGRNNVGKTSLLVLFEKFFDQGGGKFNYNDFSLSLRGKINNIDKDSVIDDLSIRMIMEIKYDNDDNLKNLSEFILDLDPEIKTVKILFECQIDKELLLKKLQNIAKDEDKSKFIISNFNSCLKKRFYSVVDEDDITKNRLRLVEKTLEDVKKLINLQIIHARRSVVSSEESNLNKNPLSALATDFFDSQSGDDTKNKDIEGIKNLVFELDKGLDKNYESFFKEFMSHSQDFLEDQHELQVKSNIHSKTLLNNSSHVVYGGSGNGNHLPENLNGLGYANILYLLLKIKIKKSEIEKENKDINLLFIEEPEAHTHPQMQYHFASKINDILKGIKKLQTLITSHSPHIVSKSNFEDIRYLKLADNGNNVEIKNFHTELKEKYKNENDEFRFLVQYLNIQSAELFFATKVIFIEGVTESMLLPYFMQQVDKENDKIEGEEKYKKPLLSQNISILEVGTNAKVFAKFLEFLGIKTLIITDIDTVKKRGEGNKASSCPVSDDPTDVTNQSLKHFFGFDKKGDKNKRDKWLQDLLANTLKSKYDEIEVYYQIKEDGYRARSFEDAFISLNLENIKSNQGSILGLKNESELSNSLTDKYTYYHLTKDILEKKSDFSSSLLFLALSKDVKWKIPSYIKGGLKWVAKN